MKIISFILFYIVSVTVCWSAEIQAVFTLSEGQVTVKEGELVEGLLKVWPIENAELNEFRKLEKTTFFNSLDLLQVQAVEVSENNMDLVEIKGLFLVKDTNELTASVISYKGQSIVIPAPSFKILKLEGKSKNFYVLEQTLKGSNANKLIMLLISIVSFFILWKRKQIKKIIDNYGQDSKAIAKKKFNILFLEAKERRDYEELYKLKDEWLKFLNENEISHEIFLKVLDKYQYKKEWELSELEEVKLSFDNIRGILK